MTDKFFQLASTVVALAAFSASATALDLVAAYSFNAGSGTTLSDGSGNANHGSIAGATWTTAGKFGGALSFDGTDDMVSVPHASSLVLANAMTLEAWVYPNALGGWRTIALKEANSLVYVLYASDEVPNPSTQINTGSVWPRALGPSGLPLNTWSHVAGTYDGSTLRLYVNGTLVASRAASGAMASGAGPLRIGGNGLWGEYFQGRIDELRIYRRALTAAEIAADMTTPVTGGASDTQAPTAPTNLVATTFSSSKIQLSWTASTDNVVVTSYLLERCAGPACTNFTQIATPTATTYEDLGLSAGVTYRYRVRAQDGAPNYSDYSAIASATTSGSSNTPPSVPSNVSATPLSSSEIKVMWTASTDDVAVAGYSVERCKTATCTSFVEVATPTGTIFNDTGLLAGTTYRYRVRARDAVPSYSGYSAIVNATTSTTGGDTQPPTTPTGLTVTAEPTQFVLSWTPSTDNVGVVAYEIERCTGASCTSFAALATVNHPTTTYTDATAVLGTTYRYRVRARDGVPLYSAYVTTDSFVAGFCD